MSNITAPCGNATAWCCPIDCAPLAYDPCCVHVCSEYNQCSCPPWTCCDVSNATIWIVYSSTSYNLNASIGTINDASCADYFNGSVTVNYNSQAVPPVLFNWNNGIRTGSILQQLEAGYYSLTVSDGTGCSEVLNFTVSEPPALVSSFVKRDVTCFGLGDGSIDLSVSGGTPPYSYNWTESFNPFATTQDLTNLGPGNYAVTVTDANGCVSNQFTPVFSPDEFTGVVTLLDNGCPIAGTAVLELCCYGTNTGSAVLSLSGGTPPPTIVWSDGSTGSTFDNLAAGTYSVTAIDANGCSFSTDFTLGQPDEISLSSSVSNTECGQCNGIATVIVNGGSGSFSFLWPPTAGSQTANTATGLCAGSYTVLVTDNFAVNCFKTITVTVSNIGAESISVNKIDASCFGTCNGSASVTYSCSAPPCSVSWFDPQGNLLSQSDAVSALCAGSYSVIVTNASGCIAGQTVDILEPARFEANLSVVNETCPGACDGIVSAAPTGGTSPYTFEWLDGNGVSIGQTGSLVTGLCAGNYTLIITDATRCSASFPFAVVSFNALLATTVTTQYLCFGECNGTIEATPLGGIAPYSYQWFANGSPIPGATSFSLTDLCAGTYAVQVSDRNGCTYTTPDIFLNEPVQMTVSVATTDLLCTSICNGTASVSASGGAGLLAYKWFDAFSLQIQNETGSSIANLCAGNYFVEVTDTNGCSSGLQPFTINDINPLTATLAATNISCNGAADGAIDLEVNGGFPPYTYSWNGGLFTTQDISGLTAGDYTVVITDSSGCSITQSATITEPDVVSSTVTVKTYGQGGYHVSCNGFSDGQLTANATGGTPPYTYQWDDPNGQIASSAIGLGLGTYNVTITDANGCTAVNSATLSLEPGPFTSDVTAFIYPSGFNVSCFGASDGSIDLTVTGGEPPFRYAWTYNGIADAYLIEDPTNVPAGYYTVNVVDTSLGCITRDTILLTEPSEIILALTPSVYFGGVNVSTNGGSDGSIDLEVSGGVPDYTYLWSTGATTQDISGLTAGDYECTVTDFIGCQAIARITLIQPEPSLEVRDTTICEGNCVFAGGACQITTGTYVDSFLNIFGLDSIIITNLTVLPASRTFLQASICQGHSYFVGGADQTESGTYYDTLTAANGCDSIIATELTVITVIQLSFDVIEAGCDATCDGSATVNASGGNPPYSIAWSNGSSDPGINLLCAGTYTVTVTDIDGCLAIGNAVVTGGQPITATVSTRNIRCICDNPVSNQSICVIDFAGLPHGTLLNEQYAAAGIHISGDGFGAGSFDQLIVFNTHTTGSQDPDLEVDAGNIAIFPTSLADLNDDGLVDAPNDHAQGGWQIYTFDTPRDVISFKYIDKESPPGNATAYDAQGNVIVSVTIPFAGNGSIQTVVLNAQGVSRLVIDHRYDSGGVTEIQLGCDITCCDGQASVSPDGGTAPYTFNWSNGAATASIDNLCVGTYDVTITDANGCTFATSATINDFQDIAVNVTHDDLSPECSGVNQLAELNFNDLPAGTILSHQYAQFGIHISGNAYSVFPDQVILYDADQNPAGPDPDLETATGNIAIFPERVTDNNANGLVDVPNDQGSGGVMTFNFDQDMTVISFVFVDKDNNNSAVARAYDASNNLIKTVNIPNGGNGSIQTITVNASGVRRFVLDYRDSGGLQKILFGPQLQCCDGSASASVTGGNPPYTFLWSNGATTESIDSLCPGIYSVTVSDADGCTRSQAVTIDNCNLNITGMTLVHDHFGGEVGPLTDGMTIDLDALCPFNIRADLCHSPVGSVKFKLNGTTFRIEEFVPYALAGDNPGGDYHSWIPQPGDYTLEATPYSAPFAQGAAGSTFTIHFTVVGTPCDARTTSIDEVGNSEFELHAHPIPFNESLIVDVNSLNDSKINMRVLDVLGRELIRHDANVMIGNNTITLKTDGLLPAAVYFLEVRMDKQVKVVKLVKE
ncbi:MAG TPA: SprB repeat-containing protein [Chitinophagales bacterium]|nr:SprB repeat-containing protein [Chitinophagales bacterium]